VSGSLDQGFNALAISELTNPDGVYKDAMPNSKAKRKKKKKPKLPNIDALQKQINALHDSDPPGYTLAVSAADTKLTLSETSSSVANMQLLISEIKVHMGYHNDKS